MYIYMYVYMYNNNYKRLDGYTLRTKFNSPVSLPNYNTHTHTHIYASRISWLYDFKIEKSMMIFPIKTKQKQIQYNILQIKL